MSSLSDIEKRYLEFILDMGGGYVLDYSDGTFGEFFRSYGVDIHGVKYQSYGTSKAKKLRAFWEREADAPVGRVLAGMLDAYEAKCGLSGKEIDQRILEKSRGIVGRLLGKAQEGVRQANWYMTGGGSLPERRSNRSTFLREPCAGTREGKAKRRQRCVRADYRTSKSALSGVPRLSFWPKATLVETIW